MKDLLFVTKLHLPVFSSAKPEGKTDEDWEFEHQQVCNYVRQFVDDNVYNHICGENDAKFMWSKLEGLYASKTDNNKLFSPTKLEQMEYKDNKSLGGQLGGSELSSIEVRTSKMVRLNGSNYHIWRNRMKDFLLVTKLHLPVFSSSKPKGKSDEDWKFEHQQVCSYIRQFVDDNVYNHICDENDAKALWSKLEGLYATKNGNNKLFYLTKLVQMKYKDDTSLGGSLERNSRDRKSIVRHGHKDGR
ncbi:unnamed protein product [Linum trigynum]|uniref:Gag-pol polyprotein n=1 Tax=Linum trigynum TaxID=586398 RepID=A0AAV2E287_9ROSI